MKTVACVSVSRLFQKSVRAHTPPAETRLLILPSYLHAAVVCAGDVVLDKARERKLINFYEVEDFSLILRATSQK